jgi:hypothetical protein
VDGVLIVEADIRQSSVFGENLLLHRRIESPIGSTRFTVRDRVTNEGVAATGHMMMYHANMGWPLVNEGAEFRVQSSDVLPRDEPSRTGLSQWSRIEAPRPDRAEEVFVHSFEPGTGVTTATLSNPKLGIALDVSFDTAQLPWLCQWKLMREHSYVVGIEPVNSPTTRGRAGAAKKAFSRSWRRGSRSTTRSSSPCGGSRNRGYRPSSMPLRIDDGRGQAASPAGTTGLMSARRT